MVYITLVGGGNSTLCLAPLMASAGHKVAILTRSPEKWNEIVTVVNEDAGYMSATRIECKPDKITSDPAEVIPQSDIVFIAGVPIHHNPELLRKVKPFLNKDKTVMIGSVCAYGGFDWIARRELGEGNYYLFGAQLIPWCCGTLEYGKTGYIIGAKRFLRIATESGTDPLNVKAIFQPILRMELRDTDFLTSCFWPNNPHIHPPILYGLFKDWDGKTPYDAKDVPEYIYAQMTDESGRVITQLDEEIHSIIEKLRELLPNNKHLVNNNLHLKACIEENYLEQVVDKSTLTTVMRTTTAYLKHKIPYAKVEGGVVPVIKHKFFETDLPYGLITFKDVALMAGVATPLLDAIILWNQKLVDKEYMTANGKLEGRDIDEAIVPSRMGLKLATLAKA